MGRSSASLLNQAFFLLLPGLCAGDLGLWVDVPHCAPSFLSLEGSQTEKYSCAGWGGAVSQAHRWEESPCTSGLAGRHQPGFH